MNEYEKAKQYLQIALNSAAQSSDDYGVNQSGYYEISTAIKALEKQIPQSVKEFLPLNRAKCPACNGIMGAHASRKYCYYCGQALEWHEEE